MPKPGQYWYPRLFWLLVLTGWTLQSSAQSDSLPSESPYPTPRLSITRLAIPSAFIGTGLYTLSDNHAFNRFRIRGEIQDHLNGYRTHLDDYLAYGPSALLAGLTVAGVKGRSTSFDRAGLWLTANAIAGAVTFGPYQASQYQGSQQNNERRFSAQEKLTSGKSNKKNSTKSTGTRRSRSEREAVLNADPKSTGENRETLNPGMQPSWMIPRHPTRRPPQTQQQPNKLILRKSSWTPQRRREKL